MNEARVWHGTPNKWSKKVPLLSKIGSGEGASAYGWGWYSASNKEIGQSYKDQLTPFSELQSITLGGLPLYNNGVPVDYSPKDNRPESITRAQLQEELLINDSELRDVYDKSGAAGLRKRAIEILTEYLEYLKEESPGKVNFTQSVIDKIKNNIETWVKVKKAKAYLLQLEIPDAKLLKWDVDFSGQSDYVKRALESGEVDTALMKSSIYDGIRRKLWSGDEEGYKNTSLYLNSLGIPGLMYLDGLSRGTGAEGYNYVIWDQPTLNRVKIIEEGHSILPKVKSLLESPWEDINGDLPGGTFDLGLNTLNSSMDSWLAHLEKEASHNDFKSLEDFFLHLTKENKDIFEKIISMLRNEYVYMGAKMSNLVIRDDVRKFIEHFKNPGLKKILYGRVNDIWKFSLINRKINSLVSKF